MRSTRQRLIGFAWFILVLIFVISMIIVAYFLTGYVYKVIAWQPPLLLLQIINTLLGLVLTGSLIGAAGSIARSRGWVPEMNVFAPIVEALERIARGDFSVRLTNEFEDNQMVSQLANSVNKMALELDQMENMRQEFISNVSHEIQSPLTSIRGFAQALKDDHLTAEERHHYLAIIEEESTRLSRITQDLLKLASLESDQLHFEPAGSIGINLQSRGDQVIFKISDTGIGISEEDQARIFERFYKADKSRTRTKAGSGLGLSIVKKIVEMHKGTIEVLSKIGIGTTFTVSLPMK